MPAAGTAERSWTKSMPRNGPTLVGVVSYVPLVVQGPTSTFPSSVTGRLSSVGIAGPFGHCTREVVYPGVTVTPLPELPLITTVASGLAPPADVQAPGVPHVRQKPVPLLPSPAAHLTPRG